MDTSELLKRVRKVEIKTRSLSKNIFSGEYHSAFKGRGMSFSEVRAYQYGDEVRDIDWNVTARTGEPHIKVFEEERELTIMLLVDVSHSVQFGTHDQWKNEWIAEICAVLGFSALQNNDKVGLILFTDQIEMYIPPKKGRQHLLRIIRELLYFEPIGRKTNINVPLAYLSNVIKKKCIAFVISDFISEPFEDTLRIASKRHDMVGIHVHDPAETNLPDAGLIRMRDSETQRISIVDTSDAKVRHAYAVSYAHRLLDFKEQFKRNQSDVMTLATDQSYIQEFHRFFKHRAS
ncbi:MAG: DUF58 domain-containing protein [Saprospiraceae bacterium]|uniref:DUF58 domain-containing protein n=1 Tax=Candidatus Opimibacter skivensis TaxID=2982028 RepID=A0A9D7XR52_9BACT|nr:DUF58 domain-containing protein [Candidatus Opimibacter skivensis]